MTPNERWDYNPMTWLTEPQRYTWPATGANAFTKTEGDDVKITKTKTLDGWLVQAFMTINGKEVIVAQDDYEENSIREGEDVLETFTETVVANLRNALA